MAERSCTSQVPNKKKISIWTFPQGSKPAVRVEITTGKITSSRLLTIIFDTLGIHERSRKVFALFKGLDPPTRKFGDDEVIYVPCQYMISMQKWSFDPMEEARAIRTDVPSLRLLALQVSADIASGRLVPTLEEKAKLDELIDPAFPSYKQYVEFARSISGYDSVVIKDVMLVKNISLKTQKLRKGTTIDIACNSKKLIIISEKKELHIPWRKVRRWTQISSHTCIGYEIYLMEEKAFTWIEIDTNQAPYLLQVTSELVGRLNETLTKAEYRKPLRVESSPRKKLTWTLFKKEVLGIGRDVVPEPLFHNIEEEPSSNEEEEDTFDFTIKERWKGKSSAAYIVENQEK